MAERIMSCLLLTGFFILARQAALVSAGRIGTAIAREEKNSLTEGQGQVIVIDPGHGGKNLYRNREKIIHYKME